MLGCRQPSVDSMLGCIQHSSGFISIQKLAAESRERVEQQRAERRYQSWIEVFAQGEERRGAVFFGVRGVSCSEDAKAMSSTNYFDLLGDDENEELTAVIARATQPPPAEKPATKKLQLTPAAAQATARLPSKPTPPAEAVKEQKALNESGLGRGEGRGTGRGRGEYGGDRDEVFQRENRGFSWDRGNYNDRGNNRENSDGHQGGNRVGYVAGGGGGGFGGVNERASRGEDGKNWSSKSSRGRGGGGGCGRGGRDRGYGSLHLKQH
ncbi:hypothetical protein MPTK1_4g03030 [Marchantia polymorpha subsp. ruderalis]|uniref:STM1-like N-terminal domain-containing protein n=2 Tax=Marchantia polymorpha TaxID=3197 RepID=A0A176VS31_MARPO|nr:hypothetical protein AXG93_4520s1000 [Marchantia polymorpha subsp. ruderalis]PTQ28156.1 hypothetical protein MARPO_0172s0023 [Marchantia polymorpha]BBN07341.1 hypothetical protein Mp_4g03030 [Marchantia polymorpha subsp. ruderalis]|eukprot:PTQ28156.1 hypothetical protein MARPO_0172s0023 [Marchantia polymorpha]